MSPESGDTNELVRRALAAAVSDFGERALSSPQVLRNVFDDYLPDNPRLVDVLTAAAEEGVATTLNQHLQQRMDINTAVHLTTSNLQDHRALDPAASNWAVVEFARAMGHPVPDVPAPVVSTDRPGSFGQGTTAPGPGGFGPGGGFHPSVFDAPTIGAGGLPGQGPGAGTPGPGAETRPAGPGYPPPSAYPAPGYPATPGYPSGPGGPGQGSYPPPGPGGPGQGSYPPPGPGGAGQGSYPPPGTSSSQPAAPSYPPSGTSPSQPAAPSYPPPGGGSSTPSYPPPASPAGGGFSSQPPPSPPAAPSYPPPAPPAAPGSYGSGGQPGSFAYQPTSGGPASQAPSYVQPPYGGSGQPPSTGQQWSPAPGPPPAPAKKRNLLLIGGIALVLLIIIGVSVAALGGSKKKTATTTTSAPATTVTTSPATTATTVGGGSIPSLQSLLPTDVSNCMSFTDPPAGLGTATTNDQCDDSDLGQGSAVYGYQFATNGEYEAALLAYNNDKKFDQATASTNCPPTGNADEGQITWHDPAGDTGLLECLTVNGTAANTTDPDYIWTIPADNVILEAIGPDNSTFQSLDAWWTKNAQG